MTTGQLFINGKDAFTEWGISLDSTGLSTLMQPAPHKAYISNESRLENGVEAITTNPKVDKRTIALNFIMHADTEKAFMEKYNSFMEFLNTCETFNVRTCYQDSVLYRLIYTSCSSFTQYMRTMAKFALSFDEPDPTNRTYNATEG